MTDLLQRHASNPVQSVFVSANAGTGKTKVLIERVLRLLLSGEVPETILCVTFTNAAAAEIEARLHSKLATWAVAQPTDLIDDIKKMTGTVPAQEVIEVARRLFAQVIDNDQGPRIETTHSFCQSLLSRFPIEAGLPPHFQLITDGQKESLLRASFASCFKEPGAEMKQALSYLIEISAHQSLFDLVKSFVSMRKLSDAAAAMPLGMVPAFERAMKAITPEQAANKQEAQLYYAGLIAAMPFAELAEARPDRMAKFIAWHSLPEAERISKFPTIISGFVTTSGKPNSQFVTKKIKEANPAIEDVFMRIAQAMIAYRKAVSAFDTIERTRALYVVGRHVALHYEQAKLRQAVLDYDDLIIKADKLLSSADAMAWVRWKLDFGIHHMLVDEAQDTNPAQWELLTSLADEFFAHEADEDNARTLFSVGDFKQSIYSFQGANPHIFIQKGAEFNARAQTGNHLFEDVKLAMSFRSSKAVLDMVNHVMTGAEVEGLGGAYMAHEAFFADKFGMVELWPLVDMADKKDDLPYFDVADFVPDGAVSAKGGAAQLAEQIACHIETMLDGTAKGLDGKSYQPRDIMILVNKRDALFTLLRGALLRHNIPVAGADRLHLNQQIEIADLLALGDICILQEDDLQLAAFLKSPLIGLGEDDLMYLAAGRRGGQTVMAALKSHAGGTDRLGKANAKLEHYFALATGLSPASFYETVLAQGGREAFHARLGTGVTDSLNAFIDQAYEFEKQGGASLADFLAHQRANDTEIKRDFGNIKENQVRIMTIHGSKGLESPVVYVPDIVKGRNKAEPLVASDEAFYWPADSTFLPEAVAHFKETDKQVRAAEHQRLLYVAMTRASECLFLGGVDRKLEGVTWDSLLKAGFAAAAIEPDEEGVRRYIHKGVDDNDTKKGDEAALAQQIGDVAQRYPWAFCAPPKETVPLRPLVPSAPDESDLPEALGQNKPIPSDVSRAGPNPRANMSAHPRLEGIFMHELLERLQATPPEARADTARRLAQISHLVRYPKEAPIGEARLIELATHMVDFMAKPEFAPLFAPEALSEFGISGIVGDRTIVGQIDKLVIKQDELWLVDFKSGRPYGADVPHTYQLQMALYAALLRDIYPDKPIKAEIIWLRDFSRSHLSQESLANALKQTDVGSH